jgi:hypothetical protein
VEIFAPIATALWVACLVAQVMVIGRIVQERLLRRYFFFALYLAGETAFGILLIRIDVKTPAYAEAFRIYSIAILVLRLGMAWELWELVCEHFPGIGRFRLNIAIALTSIAAVLAIAHAPEVEWSFPQTLVLVLKRFQSEICALVFAALWIFFRYVIGSRNEWRPNVLCHWRILTIYFCVGGITSLAVLRLGGGSWVYPINCVMLSGDLGCLFAWTWSFRSAGELLPPAPFLSEVEMQEIRDSDLELLRTVSSLPAEISRRAADSRASRPSARHRF